MKQVLLRKRNLLLLLIPLGIIFTRWAKANAAVAEKVFATGIYKWLSQGMSLLTGWIPFSLMELIIVAGPIVLLAYMIRQIVRAVRLNLTTETESVGQKRFRILMTMLQNILCLVAVIFFGYVLLCGVNYHRYPVAYHLGLTVENSTEDELAGLYTELADKATELRNKLTSENEKGVYILPYSKRELGKEAKRLIKTWQRTIRCLAVCIRHQSRCSFPKLCPGRKLPVCSLHGPWKLM